MDAKRESACPVSGNGQAWLQQVMATEAGQSIPLLPRDSCRVPHYQPAKIGSLTLQQARG